MIIEYYHTRTLLITLCKLNVSFDYNQLSIQIQYMYNIHVHVLKLVIYDIIFKNSHKINSINIYI